MMKRIRDEACGLPVVARLRFCSPRLRLTTGPALGKIKHSGLCPPHMPPYLTGIEGPPPKRNAVRSSRAGGAKNDRCKPAKTGLQRFFIIYHDWAAARLTVAP